jgi:hypothetical protein
MAADPQRARCNQPIRPGWLYVTAHRRGQAAIAEDGAVFIHVPDECPRPGGARSAELAKWGPPGTRVENWPPLSRHVCGCRQWVPTISMMLMWCALAG